MSERHSENVNVPEFLAEQTIDATALRCPLPLLRAKQAIHGMQKGQILCLAATDNGAKRDIPAWVKLAQHDLLFMQEENGVLRFWIRKA